MKNIREIRIENRLVNTSPISTITQMVFDTIHGRQDDDIIIKGHLGSKVIDIGLAELRTLILLLKNSMDEIGISRGKTVMLVTVPGSSELMSAIYFFTLTSMGVRVFMPMQCSKEELMQWVEITDVDAAILPFHEILGLDGYEMEKSLITEYKQVLEEKKVKVLDSVYAFPLFQILESGKYRELSGIEIQETAFNVLPTDEAVILATSGTTGKSKLVVYEQQAYPKNCVAWEQAGLYAMDKMGGSSFTPLIAHSMGIRGLMNALWTGEPACLISPDLFFHQPELAIDLLIQMDPRVITGGPGVFKIFRDVVANFPELRSLVLSENKTLVSCGAPLEPQLESILGHKVENAFGSTETQLALTNMLSDDSDNGLGAPLPGVTVKLVKEDPEHGLFDLFIKSDFGCSRIIGQLKKAEFHDTGDIVTINGRNQLIYAGRRRSDFIKDEFGVKIPIAKISEIYKSILSKAIHHEWYCLDGYPGMCALLFVSGDDDLGQVLQNLLDQINMQQIEMLDPLSFGHWHLARIGIIHKDPPCSDKGTVSTKKINEDWAGMIAQLRDRNKNSTDIFTSFTDTMEETAVQTL